MEEPEMDRPTRILSLLHAAFVCLVVMALCALAVFVSGCAIGVGGGRANFTMPWGDPIWTDGSSGVNAKHGESNGATLPQTAGLPGATADKATAGTADQIVNTGGNLSTDKATDANLSGGVGTQASKGSGVTGSGGPGNAQDIGGTAGGMSPQDMDAMSTAAAAKVMEALKAAGVLTPPEPAPTP